MCVTCPDCEPCHLPCSSSSIVPSPWRRAPQGKERVIGGAHDGFMQHHDEVDVNKDGKITKEEWLAPDSPARMDPFSHMDYNKDKLVTFEEFAKNEREHYHG